MFVFYIKPAVSQTKVSLNEIPKDSVRFYIGFQKVDEQFNYLQAAQKFNVDRVGTVLQEVEIHRAIIPVNNGKTSLGEPASTTFLLKIYGVDSLTGAPGELLVDEDITVKNGSSPLIKITLSKYKIVIPGKTFFVGIKWIFNERNKRLFRNFGLNELVPGRHFFQVAHIYQPFLGMVKNNKTNSDAWMMTPDGKWKLYTHNMPHMTDLSITAHILVN